MATPAVLELIFSADTSKAEAGMGKLGKSLGGIREASGMAGKAIAGIGAGAAVAGLAAAGAGAVAVTGALNETNQAANDLQAQLGVSREVAESMASVGRDVFANNWGESIEAAGAAVGQFTKAMDFDAPIEDIQKMTEQAFALEQAFDFPIEEQARAVSVLSASFDDVAADGTRAMDMIGKLLQNSDANADDLLETFGEYSPLMSQLGLDFGQFAGVLQSGLQAGARDTDFVADMFKEFGIRIVDGSGATKDALENLGLEGLGEQVQAGMVTGAEAFTMIQAELAKIPPDMQAASGAVDLFGTKFEDLGPEVFAALSTDPIEGFEGATTKLGNDINNNLGSAFATLKRTGLDAFADLFASDRFTAFKDQAIAGLGAITEAIRPAIEQLGPVIESLGEGFSSAFGGGEGVSVFDAIAESIANIDFEAVAEGARSFGEAIGSALSWMIDNKELIAEWAVKIGALVGAFALLAPVVTTLGALASIVGTVGGAIGTLLGAVGGVSGIFGALATAVTTVVGILGGPLTIAIAAVVAGFVLWQTKGDEIKAWLADLGAWLSAKWEEIRAAVATALDAILTKMGEIWDSVTSAVSTALEAIGSAIRLAWDAALRTIADKLDAILSAVTDAWTSTREAVAGALDAIGGAISQGWDTFVSIVTGAMDLIRIGIDTGWTLIKETVGSALQLIKDVISGNFDAVRETADLWISNVWAIISDGWHRVLDTIGGVLENILGFVSRIFGLIPGKIGEKLQRAVTVVGDKMFAILDTIRGFGQDFLDAALELGADLIQGIIDGISDSIGNLVGWGRRIAGAIIGGARDEADSRSPSRVMFNLGGDLIAGLELGILDGEPDALKAMETVIKNLVGVIKSGVDAILSLASLEGATLDQGALGSVRAAVEAIVNEFSGPGGIFDRFLQLEEAGRDLLAGGGKAFADLISGLASVVKSVAGLTADLAGDTERAAIDVGMVRGALASIVDIFDDPGGIFDSFAQLGAETRERLAEAGKQFAGMISGLVSVVKATEIGEIEPLLAVHVHKLEAVLRFLRDEIAPAIEEIANAWDWTTERAEAAAERVGLFNSTMGAIVGALKLSEVGEIESTLTARVGPLEAVLKYLRDTLAPAIEAIVNQWGKSNEDAKELGERVGAFNALMSPVVSLLKASEIGKIEPLVSVHAHVLESVLRFMRDEIFPIMQDLVDVWNVSSEKAADLAERVGSFFGFFDAIVGGFRSIQELASIGTVQEFGAGVLDSLLAQVRAFAKGIEGFALDVDQASAEAIAKLGPAAEAFGQVQTLLAGIFENPFMSSSRRLRGASNSVQFGQLANPNTFQARVVESIQASISTLLGALQGITIPADLGDRFEPLKTAAEAIKAAFDSFGSISVPARIDEIIRAVDALAGMGGLQLAGAGAGGGGSVTNHVTLLADTATIQNASVPHLGLSFRMQLGTRDIDLAGAVSEAYQTDQAATDRLIQVIDRRRAQRP